MDVRAHVSMVFHLDKCIGCHTCSVACKNIWTTRDGAEYMWWNNVETKPGTGYPTMWEDQSYYKGGWDSDGNGKLKLKLQGRVDSFLNLFYNPSQPLLDDYYEPWTYKYEHLFDAEAGFDQPTAIPVSRLTGQPVEIESGGNWDDDLSGSPIYAANDPNLEGLSDEERHQIFDIEQIAMFYLPRICNHCANPSCVASCPSGALYKRGEDGIVLINQDVCKGWRACVPACPYKKIYFNWQTGKSEKCILCFPRLESGQAPACFESCVGRLRYLGVLLYDVERMQEAMSAPEHDLVEAQRRIICNPFDRDVIRSAQKNGVSDLFLDAAQNSPVWKYVCQWELAFPLHVEYRTMPMLFYVPPLLPVSGKMGDGVYDNGPNASSFFAGLQNARLPIKYLANLFSAGNEEVLTRALKKLMAVRFYKRAVEFGNVDALSMTQVMNEAALTPAQAEEIYSLTAIAPASQRYVLPPIQREESMSSGCSAEVCQGCTGFAEQTTSHRGP